MNSVHVRHPTSNSNYPPPPREKIIRPEYFYVILGGGYGKNYVITKRLIPQELFCVIGGCRDLRLFHVELREIPVTPEKIILREFFCVIDYAKVSQSPENNSSEMFLRKFFFFWGGGGGVQARGSRLTFRICGWFSVPAGGSRQRLAPEGVPFNHHRLGQGSASGWMLLPGNEPWQVPLQSTTLEQGSAVRPQKASSQK